MSCTLRGYPRMEMARIRKHREREREREREEGEKEIEIGDRETEGGSKRLYFMIESIFNGFFLS